VLSELEAVLCVFVLEPVAVTDGVTTVKDCTPSEGALTLEVTALVVLRASLLEKVGWLEAGGGVAFCGAG
jgi:hypothetical protein